MSVLLTPPTNNQARLELAWLLKRAGLTNRELKVLQRIYLHDKGYKAAGVGLGGDLKLTKARVSVSLERVRQLHNAAVRKLKQTALAGDKLTARVLRSHLESDADYCRIRAARYRWALKEPDNNRWR